MCRSVGGGREEELESDLGEKIVGGRDEGNKNGGEPK